MGARVSICSPAKSRRARKVPMRVPRVVVAEHADAGAQVAFAPLLDRRVALQLEPEHVHGARPQPTSHRSQVPLRRLLRDEVTERIDQAERAVETLVSYGEAAGVGAEYAAFLVGEADHVRVPIEADGSPGHGTQQAAGPAERL